MTLITSAFDFYPMRLAIASARASSLRTLAEVPVGCTIVLDGKVISIASNERRNLNSPFYHAEIRAISKACNHISSQFIPNCDMYVTLEPCNMCAWGILNARVRRVFYGIENTSGNGGFTGKNSILNSAHNPPEVYDCIMEDECRELLKSFFKKLRSGK